MGNPRTNVTYQLVAAGIAVALLVTGCGPTSAASLSDSGDASQVADVATVNCGDSEYNPAELADAPPASSLPDGPAGAVDDAGAPAFDPSQDWKVAHHSDDRVDLVRELDEPFDIGGGDVRTHESTTLERITGATNIPDGTWFLTSAGPCAQRLVTDDDLGEADLTLASTPSPDDTSVDLLVQEWACSSGQSAEGRIQLVGLTETTEQVQLRIGVRPPDGEAQSCQGSPPTPFTVELSERLGDRDIIDASVVPPRPVTVDRNQ